MILTEEDLISDLKASIDDCLSKNTEHIQFKTQKYSDHKLVLKYIKKKHYRLISESIIGTDHIVSFKLP